MISGEREAKFGDDPWTVSQSSPQHFLAGNYMFKVNSRNTRTGCYICLKLTRETPEDTFIVNCEHI